YGSDARRHLAHHITLIGVELAELQITRGRRMRYEGPRLSIKIKGGYVEFSSTGWTLNRACCIADPDHVLVNQPSDTGYVLSISTENVLTHYQIKTHAHIASVTGKSGFNRN